MPQISQNHLWIALLALGLIVAYFQPWATIESTVVRSVFPTDNLLSWAVFGVAILSFLYGLIAMQGRINSFFVHMSMSTFGLLGTLMVVLGLLQQRAEVVKAAADVTEAPAAFAFTVWFGLALVLQAGWFLLSLFSISQRDKAPFEAMKETKPALQLPPVV